MTEEFKYRVVTYTVFEQSDADAMATDLESRFNAGWKPTTNGPAMALPMTKLTSKLFEFKPPGSGMGLGRPVTGEPVEATTWLIMFVFAKEKPDVH